MTFFSLKTSLRQVQKNVRLPPVQNSRPLSAARDLKKGLSTSKLVYLGVGATSFSFTAAYWLWNKYEISKLESRPLSPSYFSPTTLTSSEQVNPRTKVLRLSLKPEVAKELHSLPPVWSVYVKDSDIQVERPYTPLEGISESGEMVLWIKRYPHGEVGRWLHSKSPGEIIEIRGPEQTFSWNKREWDNVIMISGGTGIAPFYQLLHSYFRKSDPTLKTKFVLLQSYRSPQEFPPSTLLETLSTWQSEGEGRLKVRTFVDNLEGAPAGSGINFGRISKPDIESEIKSVNGKTLVLICGPDPMVNAIAGPKGRDNSQGPVGGILKEIQNSSFHVWKF